MNVDIIVIGAGSAGLNVAVFMNRIGLRVVLIEKHLIGGDCLNYGCIPSKALISLSHVAHAAKQARALGLQVTGEVDLKKVAATITERQEVIREHENKSYFEKKGIIVEMGSCTFTGSSSVSVNGKEYVGRRIVLATGSRPRIPSIDGMDKVKYFTNETIFGNICLPRKFLVIGGGPIGTEIAQAYQRLGSQVTVLDRNSNILPKEDEHASSLLGDILTEEGISLMLGYNSVRFENEKSLVVQKYDREKKTNVGPEKKIGFDQVLIAVGRVLNVGGLDLEKAGVELKNGKLVVDDFLRTTNKKVYAIGDVAGSYMFTHWAETQAALVIANMFKPFKKKLQTDTIAWVTYTDPELATFGRSKKDLASSGVSFDVVSFDVGDVDRAITEGFSKGLMEVYAAKGKILGGMLLAPHAGDLIGELVMAMTLGLPVSSLYKRVYPYPTMSRVHKRAVGNYLGKRLTSKASSLLRFLFRLFG